MRKHTHALCLHWSCMQVCHVTINALIHTYIRTCTHTHTHVHKGKKHSTCSHISTHAHTRVCTHTDAAQKYVRAYFHTRTHTRAGKHTHTPRNVNIRAYSHNTHAHSCTHKHTHRTWYYFGANFDPPPFQA